MAEIEACDTTQDEQNVLAAECNSKFADIEKQRVSDTEGSCNYFKTSWQRIRQSQYILQ